MPARFVVIPAIPRNVEAIRQERSFYRQADPPGFDIYDNEAKQRLEKNYSRLAEAEIECRQLNSSRL